MEEQKTYLLVFKNRRGPETPEAYWWKAITIPQEITPEEYELLGLCTWGKYGPEKSWDVEEKEKRQ